VAAPIDRCPRLTQGAGDFQVPVTQGGEHEGERRRAGRVAISSCVRCIRRDRISRCASENKDT